MKPNLSYDELKNMIPDYCFGKLSAEQKLYFEKNISDYPELVAEVSKISSAFAHLDNNYLNNIIDEKTRNLSVIVNERIAQTNRFKSVKYLKFLAPALGATLLFILIFKPFSQNVIEINPVAAKITPADVDDMLDSVTNETDLLTAGDYSSNKIDLSDLSGLNEFYVELGEVYDEFALEDFFSNYDENEINKGQIAISESNLYNIIENLNDNDVKQILEEMQDAEILSQI